MIGQLGLSEQQSGTVASSYFVTYFLSSGSSYLWINKISPRTIATVAYLCMTIGLSMAALAATPWQLVPCMAIAGLGGGSLFSLATTIISRRPEADRDFGWLLATQQFMAAGFLFASSDWSLEVTLVCAATLSLIMLASLPGISREKLTEAQVTEPSSQDSHTTAPRIALAILMVNFLALSALWAFVERIGAAGGLDGSQLGSALSTSMLAGLAGALLVTQVADHWGRQIPLWASAVAFTLACSGYTLQMEWIWFLAVTSLLSFTWNFALAYQMGVIAHLDKAGGHSALIPAAQGAGAMLGPLLGGWLVTGGDFTKLLWVVVVMILTTILGFSLLLRMPVSSRVSQG
jgi:predicted MFS family arabinose efflux permease